MQRRKNILRNYLVQWRYEESGNDWKYCRNQSMEDNSTIRVENLQPYTKYRVRFSINKYICKHKEAISCVPGCLAPHKQPNTCTHTQ